MPHILGRLGRGLLSPLHRRSASELVVGAIGLVVGLLVGVLVTVPLPRSLPVLGGYLPTVFTVLIGWVGTVTALWKRDDLLGLFGLQSGHSEAGRRGTRPRGAQAKALYRDVSPKILDTSVIIDGRILDIYKADFMDGTLVVPAFVLEELQRVADSSDVLKRKRGRRGLDILRKLQKDPQRRVYIYEGDVSGSEVDAKLVQLAKLVGGKVLSNDYNLNKVAELQRVAVLNINELANALKPVVLPGEGMEVRVIKDGKEDGQGVAYLDDGTMIVVDGGRKFMGESIGVLVTSVLQTAAGRMIFAKPKSKGGAMQRAL